MSPFRPYPSIQDVKEYLSGPLTFGYVNAARSMFGILWDILCLPILLRRKNRLREKFTDKINNIKNNYNDIAFNVLIPDLKKEYRHLCTPETNLKVLMQDRIMINPLQVPDWCTRIEDYIVAFSKCFVSENYLVGTSENLLIDLVDSLYRSRGIYAGSRNYPTFKDLYDLVTSSLSKAKSLQIY